MNPMKVPLLQKKPFNTEVCEQTFVHVGGFSKVLRHMNAERFNRMILEIVHVDHEFRRFGLISREQDE